MLSNTRTWKSFPSNTRKGLQYYIKRVFHPKRPMCSQAREGPPVLRQPTAALRTSARDLAVPGRLRWQRRRAGPSPAREEVGFSTMIHTAAGSCTPFLRLEETDFQGWVLIILRNFVIVEWVILFFIFLRRPVASCRVQCMHSGSKKIVFY